MFNHTPISRLTLQRLLLLRKTGRYWSVALSRVHSALGAHTTPVAAQPAPTLALIDHGTAQCPGMLAPRRMPQRPAALLTAALFFAVLTIPIVGFST